MSGKRALIRNSTAEFLMFTAQSGEQSIEARYADETIWLSQKLMATLFDVGVNTINSIRATQFRQWATHRLFESDFDRVIKEVDAKAKPEDIQ